MPSEPTLLPRDTRPSARTRTAGDFGDTNGSSAKNCGRKKAGERNLRGSSRCHVAENYSRTACPIGESAQVEDVGHRVEAGGLAREELRGAHRALRVGRAARGAVGDLEALARTGEVHGVVADDVAGARDREPDRPALALARGAMARENARVGETPSARRGRDLAQPERGARGRVHLELVVHLEDLDVEI